MEHGATELYVNTLIIDGGSLIIEDPAEIIADYVQIINGGSIICDFAYFSASYTCSMVAPCVDLSLQANNLVLKSGGDINCSALIVNATYIDVGYNSSISSSFRGATDSSVGLSGGSHGGIGGVGSPHLTINSSTYDSVDYPLLPGIGGMLTRGGGVLQVLSRYMRVGILACR